MTNQPSRKDRAGGTVRFRAVASDGRRSTSWAVLAGAVGSDVYLMARPLGTTAKVSLHQSGNWRHAFVSEEVSARFQPAGADRAFDKFVPPADEVAPGWIRAYAICLPESELQHYGAEKKENQIIDLESADTGGAVYVSVLLGTPGCAPLRLDPPRKEVGGFNLADGGRVLVYAEPIDVPAPWKQAMERVRREARQAAVDQGVDLASTHPAAPMIMADDNGSRLTVEVAAWSMP